VLSARKLKRDHGVLALDVAKRLMDYGFHPPTVYFPLVVPEALMVEPTETEAKETLDAFADAMLAIAQEAADDTEVVKGAPHTRPVRRLDEVKAVKQLVVKYGFGEQPVPAEAGSPRPRTRRPGRRSSLSPTARASITSCAVTACGSAPGASSPARRSISWSPCSDGST